MNNKDLKYEIDLITEYLDDHICHRCIEMWNKLQEYQYLLNQYQASGSPP